MISRKMISKTRISSRRALAAIATVLTLLVAALPARAAHVNGTFTGYETAAPLANRYLHFENRATRDIYMTPTAADGSFAADLPPGTYRLREEHGAIIARAITVSVADVPLGNVSELAPLAPSRIWDLQSLAPAQLVSAAPSTANIMTHDSVVLPTGELSVIGVNQN